MEKEEERKIEDKEEENQAVTVKESEVNSIKEGIRKEKRKEKKKKLKRINRKLK